jgi:hypothetical protein
MVPLGILEQQLLAVSIWSLQQSHHIAIRFHGWYDRTYAGETLILRRKRSAAPLTGLEAELFNAMRHKDSDIRDLVQGQWMRGEQPKWNDIVVVPEREAIAAGVLHRVTPAGRLPRSLLWSERLPYYVADIERLSSLEEPFREVYDNIKGFAESDPDVWKRLVADCGEAIGRPKPRFPVPSFPGPPPR